MKRLSTYALALVLWLVWLGAALASPGCTTTLATTFFITQDTNPSTQVYDPTRGFVANSDTTFRTWLTGTQPCKVNGGAITGAANNGGGLARLTVTSTSNLLTGQWWTVYGTNAGAYDGTWQITVVDATHVDLVATIFSTNVTTGAIWGPQVVATAQSVYNNISSYNAFLWPNTQAQASLSFNADATLTLAQMAQTMLIANTSGGNINITLPSVRLVNSVPLGARINIVSNNSVGANTITIKSASGINLAGPMMGGATATLTPYGTNDSQWVNWSFTQFGVVSNPAVGQLFIGQASTNGFGADFKTLSGDCVITGAGAITCTKTGGANLGPLATQTVPCTVGQGCTGDTGTAWATFTPVVTMGAGTVNTYSHQTGRYKCIGKSCWVAVYTQVTSCTGCSGSYTISGLPFTTNASIPCQIAGVDYSNGTMVSWNLGISNTVGTVTYYNNPAVPSTAVVVLNGTCEST